MQYDIVMQKTFELNRLPSQATYSRFFHKFSQERNNVVFPKLGYRFLKQIDVGALTIDLDSSLLTRYGNQERAAMGYNLSKKGRKSHHSLITFISQTRMVANAWMRAGNTFDHNNYETFDQVLKKKKVELVRADNGFYFNAFLEWF
nr:transposase [Sulfurovum sp. NBC37-1]